MRTAIDLLLPYLCHPRIPISFLLEMLTMLKRAKYFVAIYVLAIAVAVLVVAPCLSQAQQTPINPDVYGQLKYRYIGPEGIREYMLGILAAWKSLTMAAEEFIDAESSVVVAVYQRGLGRESGASGDMRYFAVWTFRGRAVIRLETFRDRAEALEAAGLDE